MGQKRIELIPDKKVKESIHGLIKNHEKAVVHLMRHLYKHEDCDPEKLIERKINQLKKYLFKKPVMITYEGKPAHVGDTVYYIRWHGDPNNPKKLPIMPMSINKISEYYLDGTGWKFQDHSDRSKGFNVSEKYTTGTELNVIYSAIFFYKKNAISFLKKCNSLYLQQVKSSKLQKEKRAKIKREKLFKKLKKEFKSNE